MTNYALLDENNSVVGYRQYSMNGDTPELKEINPELYGRLNGYEWVGKTEQGNEFANVAGDNTVLNITIKQLTTPDGPIDLSKRVIAIATGTQTDAIVEIHDDVGTVQPINKSFVLPIAGLYGTAAKVKTIQFVNGVARFSIMWADEGMYEVTEQQVNHNATNEKRFNFDRIEFRVEDFT
jgi:hypothetical protein